MPGIQTLITDFVPGLNGSDGSFGDPWFIPGVFVFVTSPGLTNSHKGVRGYAPARVPF